MRYCSVRECQKIRGHGGPSTQLNELAAGGSRDSLSMETRGKVESSRQIW